MKKYDVLIVGGGPCGCSAARTLAGSGARVALLEKTEHPRPKLCGGLLTWKSLLTLNRVFGWGDCELEESGALEWVARDYAIYHRAWEPLARGPLGEEPFRIVDRPTLDAALLQEVRKSGVDVLEGVEAREANPLDGTVHTDRGTFKASWIIGADGANSRMRRTFRLDPPKWRSGLAATIEVHIPREKARHLNVSAPQLHVGYMRAGYGWVFPNRERVAVGICGLTRKERSFADIFRGYVTELGIPEAAQGPLRGHPLPYGNWLADPVNGRVLLAGDAAGYVEPLLGEGIFYALYTGMLAGRAVADALSRETTPGGAYRDALRRRVFPEFRGSNRLRWAMFTALNLFGPAPLAAFVQRGGPRLVDMVQGRRSYDWLRRKEW